MFSFEVAFREASTVLANRIKNKPLGYVLYYSNNTKQPEGKLTGATIKQLVTEFRTNSAGRFKYAFIVRKKDEKVLRFYNSDVSKKFFSATRGSKKS